MEPKTALVAGLVLISVLIVWYGTLLWSYSKLEEFGMPGPAYIIVFGLLMFLFVVLSAKFLFVKE
jgi:hypothetical protein